MPSSALFTHRQDQLGTTLKFARNFSLLCSHAGHMKLDGFERELMEPHEFEYCSELVGV